MVKPTNRKEVKHKVMTDPIARKLTLLRNANMIRDEK
ncbi:30S ribosomal protein S8, partial [Bacillus cereus]|nr:30S ribosomal protein S8 [Bacillus cereus]